ncbi:MAG: ethanolamine utilization protein EutH [Clostridia bacterium]|nr:ethanolamine utilization protein EutH [Clostridia bacterium]
MNAGAFISIFMLIFAMIGAADRAIGCRFGPGKSFERGFEASGTLILAMIGPFTIAPLIARLLAPVITPACMRLGIDPSILAGLFIADDSGGWPLALALAQDPDLGRFNGSIVGSTMGCAIMFAFPVGFALTPKERKPQLAKGLAIGLCAVPAACFVGGLCLDIPLLTLLCNLAPLLIFSALVVAGLLFAEAVAVKIVTVFGYILTGVFTAALAVSMVVKVMEWDVPDLGTFDDGILIIGQIAIFLAGAFTLLFFLEKLCGPLFERIGVRAGMDRASVLGIVTTSINAIPMFGMTKDMNDRGLVVNAAYLVPASFMLGDHLAFQLSVDPSTAVPLIVGKLAGGITAVALALFLTREKR